MNNSLNIEEYNNFQRLRNDFVLFARNCLFIKTKNSEIKPFILNHTQAKVHNFIEEKKRLGKNKIVILKARQFGISTYTEGRLFHRTIMNEATNSFIMADSVSSSNNIFEMTKRFYDLLPDGLPKPELKKSNEKAIVFDEIDSSFRIGTAGNKNVGRSMTINYLHCSEVGFWENANEIIAGLFQCVPSNDKSEIILESTANGVGNYFHNICCEGLDNKSDFATLFIPWFENPEYSTIIEDRDFKLTDEEQEIKTIYKLTNEQIYWRRKKINGEFKGREYLFKQEYPATFNEAFINNQNCLFPSEIIEKARKNKVIPNNNVPIIMGVDPARNGDRTVIVFRQGRRLYKPLIFEDMTETELAGEIILLLNKYRCNKVFIDVGYGYGTIDILKEKGLGDIVCGIPFNSKPLKRELYSNKRTEIYGEMRDWLLQEGGVDIPDDQVLVNELLSIPDFHINSNGQFVMESKDEIKKMLNGKSPDIADAIALTFSENVPILNENIDMEKIKIINNFK
ncbi:hypothetical protein J5751_04820 [bacterium]|nr:hypothetical protein [bacterium]